MNEYHKQLANGFMGGAGMALLLAVVAWSLRNCFWQWKRNRFWGGEVDNVRLYNRPLSAGEVATLFNNGAK